MPHPHHRARGVNDPREAGTVDSSANQTTATNDDVDLFVAGLTDEQRQRDAQTVLDLMREVTQEPPVMWGSSIVGFGSRHYRYASGREGDTPAVSFSPRKAYTVLYLSGVLDDYAELLGRLGPHQTGKGCLNLKRVDQVDTAVLRKVIARSYQTEPTD